MNGTVTAITTPGKNGPRNDVNKRVLHNLQITRTVSPGAIEYTNNNSAEWARPPPNECPRYDFKQSDGEIPVMPEL